MRTMRLIKRSIVVIVGVFVALTSPASGAVPFDHKHFVAAIRSASVPTPADIDTHLFALADSNPLLVWRPGSDRQQLAVAIVMTLKTYESYYASGSGTTPSSRPVVWVTLAPQLESWCRQLARRLAHTAPRHSPALAQRVRRRVIQRLGLSPTTPYEKVVELWVDRANLFRPCPDPGVSDHRCSFQMQGTPHVKGIADYPVFFASLFVGSYNLDGAPWTRLGYTYDWGGRNRFGESEFMLTTNTRYAVRSAASIPAYCR